MFTFEIYKSGIDYVWGWAGAIGAIVIPFLVWYFGSSRYESNKIKEDKQKSLNYLLTSAYRYFQYFNNLKIMVIEKQNAMLQFLSNPTEENKILAFSISAPPAVDFDISPNKYSFTITNEHLIVDIIFHFLQVLSDVNGTLEYINHDMKRIFDENVPIESFIKIAQGHVSNNIPGLIYKINFGMYMLFRLMELTEDYNQYLDKKYKLMPFFIPNEVIGIIQTIKMEITMFLRTQEWEKPFMSKKIDNINAKTKQKKQYNIKNILIKIVIGLSIVLLSIFLYIYSDKLNFWKTLAGIAIACLIPFLFDETRTIVSMLKNIKEKLNPERYEKSFNLYKNRLLLFSFNFYYYLFNMLKEDKRPKNNIRKDSKFNEYLTAFNSMNEPLEFKTVIDNNGNKQFVELALNHFKLAKTEMSDLYKILNTLPNELDFAIKRFPDFINMQNYFNKLDTLLQDPSNVRAVEMFTECLLEDINTLLKIEIES